MRCAPTRCWARSARSRSSPRGTISASRSACELEPVTRPRTSRSCVPASRWPHEHRNVVRVLVGNEVLLRGDLPSPSSRSYLDRARAAIRQPVGYAETWATWLKNPEIAQHVDFIAVHLLPYWEGVDVESAVDFCFRELKAVQAAYPKKPVIIGEIGWPSEGRIRAVRGGLGVERGAVPAALPGARREGAASATTSWRPSTSPGRRATRARSAPTGASTTSTASRSSSSPRRSCAFPSGTCWRRSRWRWRC